MEITSNAKIAPVTGVPKTAPKPAASAGQMKDAKRPIKNTKGKIIG
jgi:hypothetical protein